MVDKCVKLFVVLIACIVRNKKRTSRRSFFDHFSFHSPEIDCELSWTMFSATSRVIGSSLFLMVISFISKQVECTPLGAPQEACATMTPKHASYTPQTSPSPYVTIPTVIGFTDVSWSVLLAFIYFLIFQLMEDQSVRLTLLANSTGFSTFRGANSYFIRRF